MTKVTQADRNMAAAHAFWRDIPAIGRGDKDDHSLVQAFANHRLTSASEARRKALEEAALLAGAHAAPEAIPAIDYDEACLDIATAIRSLLEREERDG